MEQKTLFTKQNVGKFFNTQTGTLPEGAAALVKTLSENYGANASAVIDATPSEFSQPIISEMLGSYSKSVYLIVHGWAGNA